MTLDTLTLAKELRGKVTGEMQLLRGDVEKVRLEPEAKIEQLRSQLVMWFIGTNLTLAAIIIAVVKL